MRYTEDKKVRKAGRQRGLGWREEQAEKRTGNKSFK
jgi:hypothetical protein